MCKYFCWKLAKDRFLGNIADLFFFNLIQINSNRPFQLLSYSMSYLLWLRNVAGINSISGDSKDLNFSAQISVPIITAGSWSNNEASGGTVG